MKAVAAQNARVDNPVYHVVVSWPAGERPTDDEAFMCTAHVLCAVGMASHQYVAAVHRDTRNVHMHIVVNRVHPATFRAVYPDRDYYKLDKAMRELELRFGWSHDNGPYMVRVRDGSPVIAWRTSAPETQGHMPSAAADMERHSDRESFISYVRGEPRRTLVPLLSSGELTWAALHAHLEQYGLAIREKGQGLAIFDLHSTLTTPVKASDMHEALSKARLTKLLGGFEKAVTADAPVLTDHYDKFRPPKRGNADRDFRRILRAEMRRELMSRYKIYRAQVAPRKLDPVTVKGRFAALRMEARRRRQLVRVMYSNAADRKAQYSIIAFETLKARERLREGIRSERSQLQVAFRDSYLDYRHWVEHLAATGDAAAISQLRGWAYAAQRNGRDDAGAVQARQLLIKGVNDDDPAPASILDGIPFRVRRDGAVRHEVGRGVIDHGRDIEIVGPSAPDSVCLVALLLAYRRYGASCSVEGTPQFQQQMAQLMATWPSEQVLRQEIDRTRLRLNLPQAVDATHLANIYNGRESI